MRKGFDTLAALVREFLGADPLSGHLFLFISRNRSRLKILYWDGQDTHGPVLGVPRGPEVLGSQLHSLLS